MLYEQKKWHTSRQASVSLIFLRHFDVFCDLLGSLRRLERVFLVAIVFVKR